MAKKDLITVYGRGYNQGIKTWLKKEFFGDFLMSGTVIFIIFVFATDLRFYSLYAAYETTKSISIFLIVWMILALIRYPFYRNYKIKEDNLSSEDIEKKCQELLEKRLKQHSSIILGIYFAIWFPFVFMRFIRYGFEYGFGFNEFLGFLIFTILFGILYLVQLSNCKRLISQIQFKNQAKK